MDIFASSQDEMSLESQISKTILNNLYEGIYFVDRDRQIKFWNKGAETISGYSTEEMLGKYCYSNILSHQDDCGVCLCQNKCPLVSCIEKGSYIDKRIYLKHKNGSRIPVWAHVAPLKDKSGEIIGAVEYFIDDSDYESLKIAKNKLEMLNEQKNQFLGMAAHDLRNPLTLIYSFSRMIPKIGPLTTEQSSMLEHVGRACDKMLSLINGLLDIAAIESGKIHLKYENILVKDLLDIENSAVSLLAKEKNLSIEVDIANGEDYVTVDREKISQVLDNLLTNAIKYSPAGEKIVVKAFRDGLTLNISVIDEGPGIQEEEIPYIFNPFHRTSNKATGTAKNKSSGLGLVIVKKIVEAHKGIVNVHSKVDEGSTFSVSLPYQP